MKREESVARLIHRGALLPGSRRVCSGPTELAHPIVDESIWVREPPRPLVPTTSALVAQSEQATLFEISLPDGPVAVSVYLTTTPMNETIDHGKLSVRLIRAERHDPPTYNRPRRTVLSEATFPLATTRSATSRPQDQQPIRTLHGPENKGGSLCERIRSMP
jgi:hypothetical protein